MPIRRFWRQMLGGVFVLISLVNIASSQIEVASKPTPAAAASLLATLTKEAPFNSELSPQGFPLSPGSPEPVRIAAAYARRLFSKTRWEEFVATSDRWSGPGDWTVRIEPKSGELEDVMWVTGEGNHVKSFGFRRKDKLRGYRGKSKKGASPGFCR